MKLDQSRMPIYEALQQMKRDRLVPFDVPGHKHGKGNPELTNFLGEKCMSVDVNSMKPLDNLCHPVSVIKEAEQLAADAFNAAHAFFMVGGTTSSVQSMIMASVKAGEKIIMPRNVHRSAINAMILTGAIPIYVNPEVEELILKERSAFNEEDRQAIFHDIYTIIMDELPIYNLYDEQICVGVSDKVQGLTLNKIGAHKYQNVMPICDIRRIRPNAKKGASAEAAAAAEVAKYITKIGKVLDIPSPDAHVIAIDKAVRGRRLRSYGGIWCTIRRDLRLSDDADIGTSSDSTLSSVPYSIWQWSGMEYVPYIAPVRAKTPNLLREKRV